MAFVKLRAMLLVIAGSAGGCTPHALAPLLAQAAAPSDATQVAAVPTGDGAKYVSVITEGNAPRSTVRNRWKREAAKTCEGDYVVLSENAAVRSSGGLTASRMHEGFVRCVSPEATLAEEDKPASDAGRSDGDRAKKQALPRNGARLGL